MGGWTSRWTPPWGEGCNSVRIRFHEVCTWMERHPFHSGAFRYFQAVIPLPGLVCDRHIQEHIRGPRASSDPQWVLLLLERGSVPGLSWRGRHASPAAQLLSSPLTRLGCRCSGTGVGVPHVPPHCPWKAGGRQDVRAAPEFFLSIFRRGSGVFCSDKASLPVTLWRERG